MLLLQYLTNLCTYKQNHFWREMKTHTYRQGGEEALYYLIQLFDQLQMALDTSQAKHPQSFKRIDKHL